MTDDEFFSSTDELKLIYQWARSRYAAPWAVFGAVLLRVAASTGPHVQLPGIIGGRASLNLGAMFVAPSGGGKGVSDKVARLAWPATIIERPIGSGEGISALFAPPKKDGVEPITRAILSVPEVDTLTGLATRQGNILLAQLKGALMGELIGQSNASEATTRVVQPHTYRCCLSIGAQPGHAQVIFNDATGGSPQRFLWFPTTDPDMPAAAVDDPEPLNTRLPAWALMADDVTEIQYGTDEIRDTIITAHLARQRGEGDALDGHALLARCKVAAAIAILHHRSVVSEADWELSAVVMAKSDHTRGWMIDQAKASERAKARDRAQARAAGEDFYDASRLETVKRSLLRMLERDGEQAGNVLRSRLGRKEKRELFDQAISLLIAAKLVESVPGDTKGTRYRLDGQGDHVGQGLYPQFNGPDRVGQGDHTASITDLDSRRSHDSTLPKMSCPAWLEQHRASLVAAGQTTATGPDLKDAGIAAGHSPDTVKAAINASDNIKPMTRSGGIARYSLTGEDTGYMTCKQWIHTYLDALPANTDEVDKDQLRLSAESAGYGWESTQAAVSASGRIEKIAVQGSGPGRKTIWRINRANAEEETPA